MTVAAIAHPHPADAPDAELTQLARGVGVFAPTSPLTGAPLLDVHTQVVELDRTGGFEVLDAVLREKTAANPVIAIAPKPPRGGLRAVGRRLAAWAASVIETARETFSWVTDTAVIHVAVREVRRSRYRGRHNVKRAWYGRQRSTAEHVNVVRREARTADSEGHLPAYWVGYVASLIEKIREQHEALHPTTGHRFVCS